MFSAKDLIFSKKTGGYTISRSLRFRSSASAYLNRTPGVAGNRKTWTFSAWIKLGSLAASTYSVFGGGTAASNWGGIEFDGTNGVFSVRDYNGTANDYQIVGTPYYRDYSAWYHLVVKFDDTQATAANRLVIYINGSAIAVTGTYPVQNTDYRVNSAAEHRIMRYMGGAANYLDGYLAEVNFIDGQALTPSSFGETDATTGVWKPKAYTGGSYGTNGFYLKFADNSGATATTIGKDSSGNGNNWTPTNIVVTSGTTCDSMIDTPTPYDDGGNGVGNYCVLNAVNLQLYASSGHTGTITNGNLTHTATAGTTTAYGTIQLVSGKWYWEGTATTINTTGGTPQFGVQITGSGNGSGQGQYAWTQDGGYNTNGGGSSSGITFTTGDVIMIAYDVASGKLWFGKNGTWNGSGSPATGANPAVTVSTGLGVNFPITQNYSNSVANMNFGQRPFTYTPPSGFKALNTQNLPTPTIAAGNKYMDVVLYTGNGSSTRTITGLAFQPDFVWLKGRSTALYHGWVDAVRGVSRLLWSNVTNAEILNEVDGSLSAFNADGFTISAGSSSNGTFNLNGTSFVGWSWKANGSGSSNTSGSITSTVSANTTAGFSVVTYTGTGANATVGHGLGVAPSMIIVKNRDVNWSWRVYHSSLANTQILYLDATSAAVTDATAWNSTSPTSNVFSVGTSGGVNESTKKLVAYCFAAVAGYSAFGSYTGNGSADGPFVFTNFQPRFIMVKRTDTVESWNIVDTARDTYNQSGLNLYPNLSNAEGSNNLCDVLSNGFKIRNTWAGANASGGTYIYACFASNPFKFALAR
jgi:hypothetical protein